MNTKILTVVLYLAAFILVTIGLIYLNNKYNNIFQFDFSPVISSDSLAVLQKIDSLKKIYGENYLTADTTKKQASTQIEHQKEVKQEAPKEIPITLSESEKTKKPVEKKEVKSPTQTDQEYLKWKEETVKILEQLDPKKAAKLISTYSDNIGRDLIYSMNKKKAAKIISELDTEKATKLLRAN